MHRAFAKIPHTTLVGLIFFLILSPLALEDGKRGAPQDPQLQPPQELMGISGTTWFPIGPAPLNFGQAPAGAQPLANGVPASGRATVIAVNPLEPDDVWLGTAAGGVWHSIQGGVDATWKPVSDQEDALAIGAIALDECAQAGCDTVYVGTGENAIRRDTYYGAGLLVGTVNAPFDVSWVAKGQGIFEFASIIDVALDPNTTAPTKRIYVALSSGTTTSSVQATVTAPVPPMGYGVYKSEDDGDNWEKLTVAGASGQLPTDLEMDPQDSDILFAGFMGRGIFKGTRDPNDDSVSWCPLNPGIAVPEGCPDPAGSGLPDPGNVTFDHVEIAIHENDSSILYATFGNCPNPLFRRCRPSIFKSSNGGATWTNPFTPQDASCNENQYCCPDSYSRYTHGLTIHPDTPNTIFVGALFLCESNDSGATLSSVGTADLHWDMHDLIFADVNDSSILYSTSDGGFARSTNGGTSWDSGNIGLQTVGVGTLSTSPLPGADEIIVGTQDNALLMWEGGSTWKRKFFGDSGSTVMDLDNKSIMFDVYNHDIIRRSTNFGTNWTSGLNNGIDRFCSDTMNISCALDNDCPQGEKCWAPTAFYPPLVQDLTAPHPLYFGTNRLYRSDDNASNWTVLSPILGGTGVFFPDIRTTNVITALAVAPSEGKRIYLGYYDGQVWRSRTQGQGPCNGNQCWEPADAGLPAAMVTGIGVHPADHQIAYVTLSGFGTGARVYRTSDGGDSWVAVSGPAPGDPNDPDSLPDIPTNVIRLEPSDPNILWLGTDRGVYKSLDEGQHWMRFSDGLPNVPVHDIAIDETRGRVFAGTHGRGVFLLTGPNVYTSEAWAEGDCKGDYMY